MYSQGSDNATIGIVIAVLAILTLVGGLLYFFVFKCKEDGGECKTTSDCCEGLECIDSKCSSSTPTVSPQPVVVVNNVEPEPDPGSNTCADWDNDYNCPNNTTLSPGIGNSPSECCRSLTCADWDNDYDCPDGETLLSDTAGYSELECCSQTGSQAEAARLASEAAEQAEAEAARLASEAGRQAGRQAETVVAPYVGPGPNPKPELRTCGEWVLFTRNKCPREKMPVSAHTVGYSADVCCQDRSSDSEHWILGKAWQNCTDVCSENDFTCENGEWGIDTEDKYTEIMGEVGVDIGICSRALAADSWEGNPSFVFNQANGSQCYWSGEENSLCGNPGNEPRDGMARSNRRLCKCLSS